MRQLSQDSYCRKKGLAEHASSLTTADKAQPAVNNINSTHVCIHTSMRKAPTTGINMRCMHAASLDTVQQGPDTSNDSWSPEV